MSKQLDAQRAKLLYDEFMKDTSKIPNPDQIQLLRRFGYTYETEDAIGLLRPHQLGKQKGVNDGQRGPN